MTCVKIYFLFLDGEHPLYKVVQDCVVLIIKKVVNKYVHALCGEEQRVCYDVNDRHKVGVYWNILRNYEGKRIRHIAEDVQKSGDNHHERQIFACLLFISAFLRWLFSGFSCGHFINKLRYVLYSFFKEKNKLAT